jgi:hypothetical protein
MWRRSFIATTVALGGTVDDAIAAVAPPAPAGRPALPMVGGPEVNALVAGLRAPHRANRATALALAVRDIMLAIEEATLMTKAPGRGTSR